MNPPDTAAGAERLRRLEIEFTDFRSNARAETTNIKEDLTEIKDSIKGLTRIIWAGFSVLFIGFISALGILVSQGGIH